MAKSVYTPKEPPAETASLTRFAKNLLRAAAARTGAGKSNVVEHLLRKHSAQLTADEFEALADEEPVVESVA